MIREDHIEHFRFADLWQRSEPRYTAVRHVCAHTYLSRSGGSALSSAAWDPRSPTISGLSASNIRHGIDGSRFRTIGDGSWPQNQSSQIARPLSDFEITL